MHEDERAHYRQLLVNLRSRLKNEVQTTASQVVEGWRRRMYSRMCRPTLPIVTAKAWIVPLRCRRIVSKCWRRSMVLLHALVMAAMAAVWTAEVKSERPAWKCYRLPPAASNVRGSSRRGECEGLVA